MNSLMFTLSGTPLIRYGEEIGMGDDMRLPERNAIRTRKECPEFGWGEMQFLKTDKSSVLAHACTWHSRTVVAVYNLSRASLSVKIDWPKNGGQKLYAFGRTNREPRPDESSALDLDGYDYVWLRLQPSTS
jgi:maltose alpha-D-glucosyltransferase/alpha-amylase